METRFKEGDVVKLKTFPPIPKNQWSNAFTGLFGKENKFTIRTIGSHDFGYPHDRCISFQELICWHPEDEFELYKEAKSLVGRYLKALVDNPQGTGYKKDSYHEIVDQLSSDQYRLKRGCIYYTDKHNPEHWELMPEGFNPDSVKETPKFEVGKWYKALPEDTKRNGDIYYGKFERLQNSSFVASSYRVSGEISNLGYTFGRNYIWKEVTDLSEIQDLLPEGHPDKFPTKEEWIPQVGDWVVSLESISPYRKIGDVFKIHKLTSGDCIYYLPDTNGFIKSFRKALPHEIPAPSLSVSREEGNVFDDSIPEVDECETCSGEGETIVAKLLPSGHHESWDTCPDCKGEGFVEKSKETMNTYGLEIGDTLPQNIIRGWVNKGINYYSDHKWVKREGSFSEDRKILQFDIMEGVPAFRISGTSGVWARCEGFLEFMNSFEKPKASFILPEKWCVKGGKDLEKSTFRDWKENPEGYHGNCEHYYFFNGKKIYDHSDRIIPGYTEITFDQFKEHVLNKPNEPVKTSLNDLVEKAKRDYPVGSEFYDLVHKAPFEVASHNFDTFGNDDQLYVPVKPRPNFSNKTARLYKDGEWAKKVYQPFKSRVRFKVGDEVTFITEKSYYYSEDGSVEKGTVTNKGKSFNIGEISTKHPDLIRFTYDKDIWYMEGDFKLKKSVVYSAGVDPYLPDGIRQVEYNPIMADRVTAMAISEMQAMQSHHMSDVMSIVGIPNKGKSASYPELKTKSINTKLNTHVDRTNVELPEIKQKSKSIKF